MKLATVVFVSGPDGESHRFGPDSELPEWVASAVTNPKAWDVPPTSSDILDEDGEKHDTSDGQPDSTAEGADGEVAAQAEAAGEPAAGNEAATDPKPTRGRGRR